MSAGGVIIRPLAPHSSGPLLSIAALRSPGSALRPARANAGAAGMPTGARKRPVAGLGSPAGGTKNDRCQRLPKRHRFGGEAKVLGALR